MAPRRDRARLPLWHSVDFRNEFRCTCYIIKLIKEGVFTCGPYLKIDNPRFLNIMPRTWKAFYAQGTYLLIATT